MSLGHSFEVVMDAAKLGSEWAWATIYREVAGPLTGYFRAVGVDDPEDAAGDVYFDLAREIGRFQGDEDDFQTLLFSIAHNRYLAEITGSAEHTRTKLSDRILERMRDTEAPLIVPTQPHAGLESLPVRERDVVSLRIMGELTIEQVGEILNLGTWTVKSLQRKGLSRLRSQTDSPGVLA